MKSLITAAILSLVVSCCFGQMVDLRQLSKDKQIEYLNREGGVTTDGNEPVFRLNAKDNMGVAWLNGINLTNGIIEFDIKGKDVLQQSFVGIAFHGTKDNSADVIYFRPFNFRATDSARHAHAVQYISVPAYDWPLLREKFPGKYEQPIEPTPDPNEWFHAKIVVDNQKIAVYVNGAAKPALAVQQLVKLNGGRIGFWVGNGSDGNWKNLVIKPDKN